MTDRTAQILPGDAVVVDVDFGDSLEIIDPSGGQHAELVCINRGDRRERFSAPNTMLLNKRVYLSEGDGLFSYLCQRMMTVVDSRDDGHDMLPGPADDAREERMRARRGLLAAAHEVGLREAQVPFPVQVFTHHTVGDDGSVGPRTSTSADGSRLRLRADLDLVAVLVNAGLSPIQYAVLDKTPEKRNRQ